MRRIALLTAALMLLGSGFALAQGQGQQPSQAQNSQAQDAQGQGTRGRDPQLPPAAQSDKVKLTTNDQPVTGKTGQHGTKLNTTTTRTTGQETPGFNTENGIAQQPGKQTTTPQKPYNPPPRPGAPPNWEQVGQQPKLADDSAAAASRAEIGGPEGTLGVSGAAPPADQAANARQNAAAQKRQATGANRPGGVQAKPTTAQPPQR